MLRGPDMGGGGDIAAFESPTFTAAPLNHFLSRLEAVWTKYLFEAIGELPAIQEGDLET